MNVPNKPEERVKFLDDKLIYDYGWLRRIYGQDDEYAKREILYRDISNLLSEPKFKHISEERNHIRLEPIYVEKVGKTIVFYLEKCVERACEAAEEFLDGPFLVDEK